jgi:hypothetical protein
MSLHELESHHNRQSSPRSCPSDDSHLPNSKPIQEGLHAKTPLPYMKILPLAISRCSEGLIYAVIFPYINEMILSFGVPEQSVGIWSALVVGLRLPLVLISGICPYGNRGCHCAALSTAGRPLGKTTCVPCHLEFMGCLRCHVRALSACLHGSTRERLLLVSRRVRQLTSSGLAGRLRCLISNHGWRALRQVEPSPRWARPGVPELTSGFALFSPALTVGITLGLARDMYALIVNSPLIGGFLANPVPRLMQSPLLARYPYLLPAIVSGCSGFVAVGIGVILLPEVNRSREPR